MKPGDIVMEDLFRDKQLIIHAADIIHIDMDNLIELNKFFQKDLINWCPSLWIKSMRHTLVVIMMENFLIQNSCSFEK